jgi:hypothetical protein
MGALHMAHVFGLPYRIFVALLGVAVSILSVTGVVIWWKKRQARVHGKVNTAMRRDPDNAVEDGYIQGSISRITQASINDSIAHPWRRQAHKATRSSD